jgi:DNA-binding beta-propeller fold protein YncE
MGIVGRRVVVLSLLILIAVGRASYSATYLADEPACSDWKTNPNGIAVVDAGQKLYVTDEAANRIVVISTQSSKVKKIIHTAGPTFSVTPSADGRTAYVLTATSNGTSLLEIDTKTDSLLRTQSIGAGSYRHIAVDHNGATVYAGGSAPEEIVALDVSERHIISIRRLHASSEGDIGSSHSQILSLADGSLRFLKAEGGESVGQIHLGSGLHYLSVSPDGSVVAIATGGTLKVRQNQVTIIRVEDRAVLARVAISGDPAWPVFSNDSKELYIDVSHEKLVTTHFPSGESVSSLERDKPQTIEVINVRRHNIDMTVPVKGSLGKGVVSPDNRYAYYIMALRKPDKKKLLIEMDIAVLDRSAGQIIATVPIPLPEPDALKECGSVTPQ